MTTEARMPTNVVLMNTDTLKALKGSIAKWERIVAALDSDRGVYNCPLCTLFHPMMGGAGCKRGCPVAAATGQENCCGTPYEEYCELREESDCWNEDELERLAQAELEFLIGLLPAGEREEP